ncbi:MAG TPA: AmmeMemoRadiSam system protein A [Candidatus Acidoferrum sp.]|nr:AmmeMemoRadiSam system protein A [Candidatus Acidoferrum sp.]
MSSLADSEKKLLLGVARRGLVAAAERREPPQDFSCDTGLLSTGAFVTLHRGSRLRGCIGQLSTGEPLVEMVARCARSAALEDPRFSPVVPDEVAQIEIEISVLSPLEDITLDKIEPGTHGLIVSQGWRRGVLLPQVATQFGWTAERFLEETCVKAGLDREAWKDPETRVQAFTAEVFSESRLRESHAEPPVLRKSRYSSST